MPERPIELPCPSCGYNVIAQVVARTQVCPECGCELPPVKPEPAETLPLRWQAACPPKQPTRMIVITLLFSMLAPMLIVASGLAVNVYLRAQKARLLSFRLIIIAAALVGVISLLTLPIRLKRDVPLVMLLTPLILLGMALFALLLTWGVLGVL